MEPWEVMGWMLRLEAERRGYKNAKEQLFLADGAKHIREVKKLQFPESTFILDWAHAAEHVSNSAKAAFGEGTQEAHSWYRKHKHMLWNGKRDDLLADFQELSNRLGPPREDDSDSHPRTIVHRDAFSYFPDNYEAIDYPSFRQKGWPIGSGVVEGGVNQFSLRLKGAGKFWNVLNTDAEKSAKPSSVFDTGAEEMLALCAVYHCEDGRWDQYWRRRAQPPKRE